MILNLSNLPNYIMNTNTKKYEDESNGCVIYRESVIDVPEEYLMVYSLSKSPKELVELIRNRSQDKKWFSYFKDMTTTGPIEIDYSGECKQIYINPSTFATNEPKPSNKPTHFIVFHVPKYTYKKYYMRIETTMCEFNPFGQYSLNIIGLAPISQILSTVTRCPVMTQNISKYLNSLSSCKQVIKTKEWDQYDVYSTLRYTISSYDDKDQIQFLPPEMISYVDKIVEDNIKDNFLGGTNINSLVYRALYDSPRSERIYHDSNEECDTVICSNLNDLITLINKKYTPGDTKDDDIVVKSINDIRYKYIPDPKMYNYMFVSLLDNKVGAPEFMGNPINLEFCIYRVVKKHMSDAYTFVV